MIDLATALAQVHAGLTPGGTEIAALTAAHGRVLAADVVARVAQPAATVSAMDGYAFRSGDAPPARGAAQLALAEQPVAAGGPGPAPLPDGTAVRVFTGGVLPSGADTVVMQERVTPSPDGAAIRIETPPRPGAHVRPEGMDFQAGDTVLTAGQRLTARGVSLAAAADQPWLTVHRKPIVAVLVTGAELSLPGTPRSATGLPNANGPGLGAAIEALGGRARILPPVGDDQAATRAAIAEAAGADLLVTTGGASVGVHDVVRPALAELGYSEAFWQVAVRPGKPVFFGHVGGLGGLPVLGLPGNPVSVLVGIQVFGAPALRRLAGVSDAHAPAPMRACLATDLPAEGPRRSFLRAAWTDLEAQGADALPRVTPFGGQDSAMIAEMARADVLIDRPAHDPARPAGDVVTVWLLAQASGGL